MARRPWVRTALWEILPTAIVGVVVFQFIRAVCFERYLVPSESMEPVLHGNPKDGDVVLVNKLAYRWGNRPARFEQVVLENPSGGAHLVKRAVAFGGERVRISQGDLWVGEVGGPVRRIVKSPDRAAPMLQLWFGWRSGEPWNGTGERVRGAESAFAVESEQLVLHPLPDAAAPFGRQGIESRLASVPPRYYPAGLLSTAQAVDADFVCADGRRRGQRGLPVRDAMMVVEAVPEPGVSALLMVFEYYGRPFAMRWSEDGIDVTDSGGDPERVEGPPLAAGEPRTVCFGFLDGRLLLAVDGDLVFERPVPDLEPQAGSVASRLAPANALHLGCYGAETSIRALRIEHDIHYLSSPSPRRDAPDTWDVDGDEIFLLGDNTIDSRDSRDRSFPSKNLLGRPILVLGPWPRTGWVR